MLRLPAARRWRTVLYATALAGWILAVASPVAAAPSPSPGTADLQRQKLQEEIRQLQLDNDRHSGVLAVVLDLGPLITVLIGVGTLAATLYKQSRDLADARRGADAQAEQWRAQFAEQQRTDREKSDQWRSDYLRLQQESQAEHEKERLRRFDQHLTEVVGNIGSTNPAQRLNAAAALGFYVKADYADLHCDLLNVIIANLKAKPDAAVTDLLRRHLAKVLHLLFDPARELDPNVGETLNLTDTDLYRIDLHGLALPPHVLLDVAFATLKQANFREATLFRVRGLRATLDGASFSRARMEEARFNEVTAVERHVDFHETRLISATFDDARLPGAEFQQALLQGARFRRADLTGARFEDANLADARFEGATFDDAAIRSIALGAKNWRGAFFDEDVRARLAAVSATRR